MRRHETWRIAISDIGTFIREGWRNIWKVKLIFLFAGVTYLTVPLSAIPVAPVQSLGLALRCLWLLGMMLYLVGLVLLSYVSGLGAPYVAYCAETNHPVTIVATWSVIRPLWWKVLRLWLLLGFVVSLLALPFACMAGLLFQTVDLTKPSFINSLLALLYLLAPFAALGSFAMLEIIARGSGVSDSVGAAWRLLKSHFRALASLGVMEYLLQWLLNRASYALGAFLQSGFDPAVLRTFRFFAVTSSSDVGVLYRAPMWPLQILATALIISTFAVAYVRYSAQAADAKGAQLFPPLNSDLETPRKDYG